jgi:hypothetical protein
VRAGDPCHANATHPVGNEEGDVDVNNSIGQVYGSEHTFTATSRHMFVKSMSPRYS